MELSQIKYAFVINSFNRKELLDKGLQSLNATIHNHLVSDTAIVIYDDGSTDGSILLINEFKAKHPDYEVHLVTSIQKRTFSEGCNYAVEYAANIFLSLSYFMLFETDNFFSNHKAFDLAIKLLDQNEKLAAAGYTVQKHDGSFITYGSVFPKLMGHILGIQVSHYFGWEKHVPDKWQEFDGIKWTNCPIVYTSPLLVRIQAWQQVGGMDTVNFPFTASDYDWARSLHQSGWKMAVIKTDGVIHDNLAQQSAWSDKRIIDYHMSLHRYFKKEKGSLVMNLMIPLLAARHLGEYMALGIQSLLGNGKSDSLRTRKKLLKSVWSGYEF